MLLSLDANVSAAAVTAAPTFPPLPHVPEPAIFDASYAGKLVAIFNDSSFPPKTPAQKIYYTRLKVVEAILASRKESAKSLSVNLLTAWVSMVLLCSVLLVRIRRNRERALLGDADAARKIILPAFESLLWIVGGANLLFIGIYVGFLLAHDVGDYYNRFTIELAYAVKLVNGLLVIVYMLQPSLSLRALTRAVGLTLFLSTYTVPVVLVLNELATPENERTCHWTLMGSRSLLIFYLIYRTVYPPARASVRSFRLLCFYVVIMMLLTYGMAESYHRGRVDLAKVFGWIIAFYSMLLPPCVWNVLRADTEHWRGIGKRAVELQDTFRRKKGKIDERVSSQGLHVLIEMHRKFIIDFARLQFFEPITDGGGTHNVTVYRGFLHTKKVPVAIKVYMPTAFNEETVAAFSHEAALCGALVHPTILQFHGLCVCPPNICLVTELCQASLHDAMEVQTARRRRDHNMPSRRQQTLVNIGYMIDAARALAYLHSFSPPFVHRDIKPSSFLIDDNGTVKLTDFGASRTLSIRSISGHQQQHLHQSRVAPVDTLPIIGAGRSRGPTTVLQVPGVGGRRGKHTAQYMAPEVIKAQHAGASFYGEAADVFSLAMTMWEILHPGVDMYPVAMVAPTNASTHGLLENVDVSEMVFAGHRPPINSLLHSGLTRLVAAGWHADPRSRPTAQALVASLETIQEELCAGFALELMGDLNDSVSATTATTSRRAVDPTSVAGTQAVEKLRIGDVASSQREAIRVGNMLMDCGFLHHATHARSFESTSALYVFDTEQIQLCQPLALLESSDELRDDGGDDASTCNHLGNAFPLPRGKPAHSHLHHHQHRVGSVSSAQSFAGRHHRAGSQSSHALMERRCACRKLGQRIVTEPTTRRRFLLKFKTVSDENLITASLLADDQQTNQSMGAVGDFAAFHESSMDRHTRQIGTSASEAA